MAASVLQRQKSVADQLLPWAIKVFQAGHPKVHFQVRIGTPHELVRDLLDDQADIIDGAASRVMADRIGLSRHITKSGPAAKTSASDAAKARMHGLARHPQTEIRCIP